jgi:hypothetical protein
MNEVMIALAHEMGHLIHYLSLVKENPENGPYRYYELVRVLKEYKAWYYGKTIILNKAPNLLLKYSEINLDNLEAYYEEEKTEISVEEKAHYVKGFEHFKQKIMEDIK